MIKRNHITEQTRQDLVEAFLRLNKERPLSKITIKDITDKAGYNHSTFYQHFKNIYELQEYASAFLQPVFCDRDKTVRDGIYTENKSIVAKYVCDFIKNNQKKLALQNGDKNCALSKVFKERFMARESAFFRSMVGESGVEDEDAFRLVMSYHLNGMFSFYETYININGHLSPEECGEVFAKIFSDGVICTLKLLREPAVSVE